VVEQRTHKPLVAGSIPASGTNFRLYPGRFAQRRGGAEFEPFLDGFLCGSAPLREILRIEIHQEGPELAFRVFVMLLDREIQGGFQERLRFGGAV
jgi:hypothetical protein